MQWAVAIPVRWAHNKTFPSQSAMQRHGHLQAQLLRASFKLFECVSCLGLQDVKILYVHVSWRNIGIVLSCFVPDLYIDIPLGAYALCIMVCSEPGEIGGFPRAARGPSTKMKTRGFDDIRRVFVHSADLHGIATPWLLQHCWYQIQEGHHRIFGQHLEGITKELHWCLTRIRSSWNVIIQWSSIQIKLRRFLKKRNGTSNNVPLSRASALLKLLQNSLTNNHCLRIESMAHFRQANLSSTGLTFRRTWQNTIDPIWHRMTGYEHAGDGSSSVVHLRWCYAVMRRYRRSDSNCSVDTISWTDIPNSEAAEPDKTSGTPRVPNCKMG